MSDHTNIKTAERGTRTVQQLVGHYAHGCRLNRHNHRRLWPLIGLGDGVFELENGWELIGFCKAPYASGYGYDGALVLEFWGDADEDDPGMWWMHCDIDKLKFKVPNKANNLT